MLRLLRNIHYNGIFFWRFHKNVFVLSNCGWWCGGGGYIVPPPKSWNDLSLGFKEKQKTERKMPQRSAVLKQRKPPLNRSPFSLRMMWKGNVKGKGRWQDGGERVGGRAGAGSCHPAEWESCAGRVYLQRRGRYRPFPSSFSSSLLSPQFSPFLPFPALSPPTQSPIHLPVLN